MEIVPITVHFPETAEEEARTFLGDIQLWKILQALQSSNLDEKIKSDVHKMALLLSDLISTDLPTVFEDPETNLRFASRDMTLGELLKERGVFRFYQLVNQLTEDGVPVFMTMENPDTGSPFKTQEEFISWFCDKAGVSRGFLFGRKRAIDHMQHLGLTLEEAFHALLSKAYVTRQTVELGKWENGKLVDIDPQVAVRMAERLRTPDLDELRDLADLAEVDPDARQELVDRTRPILADLLRELTVHDSARGALGMVRHDILGEPEIAYAWDQATDSLVIALVPRYVDEQGNTYVGDIETIHLIPDVHTSLPKPIRDDLLRRLPIKNRDQLDFS